MYLVFQSKEWLNYGNSSIEGDVIDWGSIEKSNFFSLSLQLCKLLHNCRIVFFGMLYTVKQTVVVFLVSDICSDLSKPPSSFKLPLLTGWRLDFKFVARVTTCWTYWFTEKTSTIFIWITTSIWNQSKLSQQRREKSQDLETLSIFVVRSCDSQSWS